MSLFKFSNTASKRQSLDAFKARADSVVSEDSVGRITGGALDGCHPIGGMTSFNLRSLNVASFNVARF